MRKNRSYTERSERATLAIQRITSLSELQVVSDSLRLQWRGIQQQETADAMQQFHIGDIVSFDSRYSGSVEAEVINFNIKTVSLLTEAGMHWRVSPTKLSLVDAVHETFE